MAEDKKPSLNEYFWEFLGGFFAYWLILWGSERIGSFVEGTALYWLIAISPVLPVLLIAYAMLREFRKMDEVQHRVHLEAFAGSFVATAVITFAYGILKAAGAPDLSWTFVWPIMAFTWLISYLLARLRYK